MGWEKDGEGEERGVDETHAGRGWNGDGTGTCRFTVTFGSRRLSRNFLICCVVSERSGIFSASLRIISSLASMGSCKRRVSPFTSFFAALLCNGRQQMRRILDLRGSLTRSRITLTDPIENFAEAAAQTIQRGMVVVKQAGTARRERLQAQVGCSGPEGGAAGGAAGWAIDQLYGMGRLHLAVAQRSWLGPSAMGVVAS